MPIPQVNDRIKEAPVVVLRAVFAGIGQILLTADKVRARAAEQAWTPERPTGKAGQARAWQPAQQPRNGTLQAGPPAYPPVRETAGPGTATAAAPPVAKAAPATKAATPGAEPAKTTPGAKTAQEAKTAPAAKTTKTAPVTKVTQRRPAAKSAPAPRAAKATKAAPASGQAPATKRAPAVKAASAGTPKAAPAATPEAATPEAVPAPRAAEQAPGTQAPPLPGYDDLSLASLRARLRALDAPAIEAMLAYEKAHARREPVITMLERRQAKLTAG